MEAYRLQLISALNLWASLLTESVFSTKGTPGLPGQIGMKGDAGLPGIGRRGLTGPKGEAGVDGKDGIPGPAGEKGDTGPIGLRGMKGNFLYWNSSEAKSNSNKTNFFLNKKIGDRGQVGQPGIPGEPGKINLWTLHVLLRKYSSDLINNNTKLSFHSHEWFKRLLKGQNIRFYLILGMDGLQGEVGSPGPRGYDGLPGPKGKT